MWDRLFAGQGLGGEAIIWLIIAFFWVVAQLFARTKEKNRARQLEESGPVDPYSDKDQGVGVEDQLIRFLETVGGGPEPGVQEASPPTHFPEHAERSDPPPRQQPPPPPRQREKASERIQKQRARALHYKAEKEQPVARKKKDEPRIGAMDTTIDERALDTEKAYALRDELSQQGINAFVNPRNLLVNLNYLRMNIPIVPLIGLEASSEMRRRPKLHGRQMLRQAITNQIILSNPLAMGEDKASYTKRNV